MSTIALTRKAAKLMKLCDLEGVKLEDLLQASVVDSICPAICMTEGCDYPSNPQGWMGQPCSRGEILVWLRPREGNSRGYIG